MLLILSETWSTGSNLASSLLVDAFAEVAEVNAEAKILPASAKNCRGSAEAKCIFI